jgi:hypothetical protein
MAQGRAKGDGYASKDEVAALLKGRTNEEYKELRKGDPRLPALDTIYKYWGVTANELRGILTLPDFTLKFVKRKLREFGRMPNKGDLVPGDGRQWNAVMGWCWRNNLRLGDIAVAVGIRSAKLPTATEDEVVSIGAHLKKDDWNASRDELGRRYGRYLPSSHQFPKFFGKTFQGVMKGWRKGALEVSGNEGSFPDSPRRRRAA